MLRYLDDWLVQAPSREDCLWEGDTALSLYKEIGIIVSLKKSDLNPTQTDTCIGLSINTKILKTSQSLERQQKLLGLIGLIDKFFILRNTASSILEKNLRPPVVDDSTNPGDGCLRMRSLQRILHLSWVFKDDLMPVKWDRQCQMDLLWWSEESRLSQGTSLAHIHPDLMLWSDASDQGWGAHLGSIPVSGTWQLKEKSLSINLRELKAIRLGLLHFSEDLEGKAVAVFSDNATAIAYLRNQGGTLSRLLNNEAQKILRWAEEQEVSIIPQFIPGRNNVLADSLSRHNQVIGSEWTLAQDIVSEITKLWPATIDLFATSLNHRFPVYFSPLKDPVSAGTDSLLQSWDNLQAYAFPPFTLIRKVINKVRLSTNLQVTLIAPLWPQKEWFPDLLELLLDPPLRLPDRKDLLKQPHFHRFHLNPQVLHLHAWRLSSDSLDTKVSRGEWLNKPHSLTERALR